MDEETWSVRLIQESSALQIASPVANLRPLNNMTGSKFINPFNMVRMGLANAHSAAIYRSAKYGPNNAWTMKSVSELTNLYHRLIATFAEKPYGPFNAAATLVGRTGALRMADPNSTVGVQFPAPPSSSRSPPTATPGASNKRLMPDYDDLQSDDIPLYPAQKKRKKTHY
jgi:hypothetical protein